MGHPTTAAGGRCRFTPSLEDPDEDLDGRLLIRLHVALLRVREDQIIVAAATHLLTLRTPIGRKVAPQVRAGGGPLLRVRAAVIAP